MNGWISGSNLSRKEGTEGREKKKVRRKLGAGIESFLLK